MLRTLVIMAVKNASRKLLHAFKLHVSDALNVQVKLHMHYLQSSADIWKFQPQMNSRDPRTASLFRMYVRHKLEGSAAELYLWMVHARVDL